MLHFTIRDLLWLTVVVGLLVVWSVDHYRLMETNRQLQAADKYMRDLLGINTRQFPAIER